METRAAGVLSANSTVLDLLGRRCLWRTPPLCHLVYTAQETGHRSSP